MRVAYAPLIAPYELRAALMRPAPAEANEAVKFRTNVHIRNAGWQRTLVSLKGATSLMLIASKKMPLPKRRRAQIFNDNAAMDAAVAAQHDKQVRWVRYMVDDLTTAIRKIGRHKRS